jgi:cellulose synthase/poly-beta-1,6-N-acetylglucosamine synthase-like glycosyltransferase
MKFHEQVRPSHYEIVARGGRRTDNPVVSVIVPTYERADMIGQTIDALTAQNLAHGAYEIIVVDNASADHTTRVLKETARRCKALFTGIRMKVNQGPAVSRNAAFTLARGHLIAFTDSDCLPTSDWLRTLIVSFGPDVGIVQGRTTAHPDQPQPLFNHFIETKELDGSFSTSNVCYRREAVEAVGGFDPDCRYWEDVDLGWRVRRAGWTAVFARDALVYHQVIELSATQWLLHAKNFANWPAKAARYPEFRRHLFARVWASSWHPLFQAALLGLALTPANRWFLLMAVPYLAAFPARGRLSGRSPILRAAANVARDTVSFSALVAGSIRHRSPVL